MQTTAQSPKKVKFATQISPDMLVALKETAKQEGRQIQAILDDALRAYFESNASLKPRRHVMEALRASMTQHDALYKELAK